MSIYPRNKDWSRNVTYGDAKVMIFFVTVT